MRSLIYRVLSEGSGARALIEREETIAGITKSIAHGHPAPVVVHAQSAADVCSDILMSHSKHDMERCEQALHVNDAVSVPVFDACVVTYTMRASHRPPICACVVMKRVVENSFFAQLGFKVDGVMSFAMLVFTWSPYICRGAIGVANSIGNPRWNLNGTWDGIAASAIKGQSKDEEHLAASCVYTHTLAVRAAFALMHCKGTELKEHPAADVDHKWHRRTRVPVLTEYTLHVRPGPVRRSTESDEPGETGVMPLHLCRGHFARYTEDAPLFGKHVGQFWIPQHVRGKRENGVIKKSYMV